CGFFRGQVKENGVSLNATGGTDGFFGLMDDNCNVRWVIGFGGAKDDKARTLCFNSDTSEIVIAGGIDSTLMLYGYPMITTPAAIFVARFNLQGGLASYRTYAFAPGDDGHNMGYEIE